MNLEWIENIDYNKYLTPDEKDMVNTIGFEMFLKLLSRFKKTTFYFTDRSLLMMKKKFIVENKNLPVKQLARDLELSEMTVYKTLRDATVATNDDNYDLFDAPSELGKQEENR